jgi:hypothetical protein
MNCELQNAVSSSVEREAGGIFSRLVIVMKESSVLRPGAVLD